VHALTMEVLADDAAALIAETAGGPAVVIGHSYGGFVAQELAIRHPSSVRALVLIDTTPGQLGTGEVPPADGPPLPQEAIEMMAQQPESDEQFAQQFARLFPLLYLKTLSADEAAPRLAGTVYSAAAMARGFEVLAGWSSVDRLGSISAPTLLMWGSEDLVCSLPQAGRIQSRIAGSELVVFDGVGHFPWWEAPDPFFQALRAWLSRL
jgi:pimeloyl-ACP methyl ester carboxylesterase